MDARRRGHFFSPPKTRARGQPATAQTSAPAAAGGAGPTRGPAATPTLPRLAAVDIGTNSMRLVVAEVQPDGSYRVLDQDREMTRLGRGLYDSGRIGDGPMEQSLQTLGRMKAIAEGFGVGELRAIATSAVREAANGRDFVREAWRRCRVRIEVVPPDGEAAVRGRSDDRQRWHVHEPRGDGATGAGRQSRQGA